MASGLVACAGVADEARWWIFDHDRGRNIRGHPGGGECGDRAHRVPEEDGAVQAERGDQPEEVVPLGGRAVVVVFGLLGAAVAPGVRLDHVELVDELLDDRDPAAPVVGEAMGRDQGRSPLSRPERR